MNKRFLPAVAIFLVLLFTITNSISAMAQSSNRKIPTASQAAMQSKAKGKKGVMRGTTQYDRWQAAIKHADRRAAQTRAAQAKKGGK